MSTSKIALTQYLTEQGLVVEGDESYDELREAYSYLRDAGRPVITREEK